MPANLTHCFKVQLGKTDVYKNSFFPRTLGDCTGTTRINPQSLLSRSRNLKTSSPRIMIRTEQRTDCFSPPPPPAPPPPHPTPPPPPPLFYFFIIFFKGNFVLSPQYPINNAKMSINCLCCPWHCNVDWVK